MSFDPACRRLAAITLSLAFLLALGAQSVAAAEPPPGWTQESIELAGVARAHLRDVELEAARDGRLIGVATRATADLSPIGITIFERSAGASGTWRKVATTGHFDDAPSLALAANGAIHVAWDRAGAGIRYTTNRTGVWKVEVVPGGSSGFSPSIALTNGGTPSVAFVSQPSRTNSSIRIASKIASGWTSRTVASGDVASPSLRIDQFSKRHIVWVRRSGTSPGLYYATDRSGSWVTRRLTSAIDVQAPRLVLDLARHVHVAYQRSTGASNRVLHVTNASGTWVTTVASGADRGTLPDITLDANQRPVIAYVAGQSDAAAPIIVATRTGTSWTREAATTDGLAGRPGIALLGTDVHLASILPFGDATNDGELVHIARE